jgi:hypothetical protein
MPWGMAATTMRNLVKRFWNDPSFVQPPARGSLPNCCVKPAALQGLDRDCTGPPRLTLQGSFQPRENKFDHVSCSSRRLSSDRRAPSIRDRDWRKGSRQHQSDGAAALGPLNLETPLWSQTFTDASLTPTPPGPRRPENAATQDLSMCRSVSTAWRTPLFSETLTGSR